MTTYKGGRGNKAPYTSTHVRVPEPIKLEIEYIIEQWKTNQQVSTNEPANTELYSGCAKLVNRFIAEIGQTENLHQRNNKNLVRFRDWLSRQAS